jgi:hypothetical protein
MVEQPKTRARLAAEKIADLVDANELERQSIDVLVRLVWSGCQGIDLHVRRNGLDHSFQGDWLARLFRSAV